MADRNKLPIVIRIASDERHEATLVRKTIQRCFIEYLPVNLVGDKDYDSAALRDQLSSLGVQLIS
ncbi:MAG: hypothetical protein EOO38_00385 [Cytophagaceae bacterium]|nr:MAG: hypothetical protein EOO38_00385 [Cytophagaceae bacterium]